MITYFLEGHSEKLNASLMENGLSEELCTYLWKEIYRAYHFDHTSITHWNEDCVKIVLPFIYNNEKQYGLFIDRFAQTCAKKQVKTLIPSCFYYPMIDQSLYDLFEYAVQFNNLSVLKKLQSTSIDFSWALTQCSEHNNLEMAQYLLPTTDPLYHSSYAWFCALEENSADMVEFLQPHSHIVEAGRHAIQNVGNHAYKTLLNNYIELICSTQTFGASRPNEVNLARSCIKKNDLSKLPLQSFSQPVLESCCLLAVVCKNPTAKALVDALQTVPVRFAQYLKNRYYRLFKYAVAHDKISIKDLNFLLEHSVYENKERDVLFLLRSGMDCQPTLDKWASYNPDCIDALLKSKEFVDAEKQRKVLLASTLGVRTNKERKI